MTTSIDFKVDADGPYWEGLQNGRLMIQCCQTCGAWHWPAVYRCSKCETWEPEWREVAPRGTIFTWTRNWQKIPGLEPLGLPFISMLVSLDEAGDNRLMGTLEGDDTGIAIGKPVTGEIISRTLNGITTPTMVWRL